MPELPDVTVYVEALRRRLVHGAGTKPASGVGITSVASLKTVRIRSPFLLRTFDPPIDAVDGASVTGVERLGKRIVIALRKDARDLFLVIHLMIAGRLYWHDASAPLAAAAKKKPASANKLELARFVFIGEQPGEIALTEAGTTKRASLHVIEGRDSLAMLDRGGLDVLASSSQAFRERLQLRSHTLKRALADPRLFDGIGNTYSDEILHAARLSPMQLTRNLDDAEIDRLHQACQSTLTRWTHTLLREFGLIDAKGKPLPGRFPKQGEITAFRPDFAVHGKFGQPCPVCQTQVQRIAYAQNECNYCPRCQTSGKLFADRSLSRLLKDDWPRTIDELEEERGETR